MSSHLKHDQAIETIDESTESPTSGQYLVKREVAHGVDNVMEKVLTTEVEMALSNDSLWDSFWAKHGTGDSLFDRILWMTRLIFSRRHAMLLLDYWRKTAIPKGVTFKALEVGCGSATTSNIISHTSTGAQNYVVDLSVQAIKIARDRNPHFRCVVADALSLPFAAETFSLTFSSGVIEHFDRSIAHRMHAEHCRVTKADETAAVIVPWKHSPYNLLRILCGKRWPFGHENPFSIGGLQEFFSNHPLREVSVRTVFGTTLIAIGVRE